MQYVARLGRTGTKRCLQTDELGEKLEVEYREWRKRRILRPPLDPCRSRVRQELGQQGRFQEAQRRNVPERIDPHGGERLCESVKRRIQSGAKSRDRGIRREGDALKSLFRSACVAKSKLVWTDLT